MAKEIAKVQDSRVVDTDLDMGGDAGQGFGDAGREAFVIPTMVILQELSPACKRGGPDQLEGAEPGMIMNIATKEIFNGSDGVIVVPFYYTNTIYKWVDRDSGGGFRGVFPISEMKKWGGRKNDKGTLLDDEGLEMKETREHYCLLFNPNYGSIENILIAMSSTQIKRSKRWMTDMRNLRIKTKDGNYAEAPMYANRWRLCTREDVKGKDTWYSWDIYLDFPLGKDEEDIYIKARDYSKALINKELDIDRGEVV